MNSVAPRAPAQRRSARPAASRAAAEALARRGRLVTGGRGRSVGQLERRRAGELRPPVASCACERSRPRATARCQTAKSAYWTASSGSGDGAPPREGVVERRQLAEQDAERPAVGDDVVHGQEQRRGRSSPSRSRRGAQQRAARPGRRAAARLVGRATQASTVALGSAQRAQVGRPERRSCRRGAIDLDRRGRRPRRNVVRSASWRRHDLVERPLERGARRAAPQSRTAERRCCRRRCPARAGRGTTAAAARTTAAAVAVAVDRRIGGACGPAPGAQRPRPARPGRRRSGASNSARSGSSTPNASRSPGHDCVGQQRVAAEVEEVVVDARPGRDPRTSRQMPASASSTGSAAGRRRRSGGRGRRPARAAPCGRPCRWASAAGRRARTNADGTMYSGSRCPKPPAQLARPGCRPVAGHDVGDQPRVARHVLAGRDHRLADAGCRPARPRSRPARSGSRGP